MRKSALKSSSDPGIDPLKELISYVQIVQQSKNNKASLNKIESYFDELGEPLKKLLPKVAKELQEYFEDEIWQIRKSGIQIEINKKEGRYYKTVYEAEPGNDFKIARMVFRSPEAAIAYLGKRKDHSRFKNLLLSHHPGENVILHETSYESNRFGTFIWCFVSPNDPTCAMNIFFSDEWTAKAYASKNGFRIVGESGSYHTDDDIAARQKYPEMDYLRFIFSFPIIRPIPEKRDCTDSEKEILFGDPCYDDNDIRLAKKRAIDQKSKFIELYRETNKEEEPNKIPNIAYRVDCKRLVQSLCNLKEKISELQLELQQIEAVLGLFGQSTEEHIKEYGKMLYDYYYDEQKSYFGGTRHYTTSDYNRIIVHHAKLERATINFTCISSPGFEPKPGQKVSIKEVVKPLDLPLTGYDYVYQSTNYCFIDPNSPEKYQPVFFRSLYDIQREAFIKNYIIVDEEGFEVLNPITYNVYVLEDFVSMHSFMN